MSVPSIASTLLPGANADRVAPTSPVRLVVVPYGAAMELSRRAFVLGATALVASGCSGSDHSSTGSSALADRPTTSDPIAGTGSGPASTEAVATTTSAIATSATAPEPTVPLPAGVFSLGVASGDPLPDRVILWTRLDPPPPAAPLPDSVTVRWEMSTDIDFSSIVASGTVQTTTAHAHSVHVDATGLAPATTYRYRFIADGQVSTVGSTRTTPLDGDAPSALRFGFASCQQYQSGFYAAWRDASAADLDLIVFLGDYIYESSGAYAGAARQLDTTEDVETLDAYRARYALHKRDLDLQAAHASCPWLVIWDDHEVTNNYAGDRVVSSPSVENGLHERRGWAYQAWWEHQPVRLPAPSGAELQIHRSWHYGNLVNLFLLDERQYRAPQACGDRILETGPACAEVNQSDRTMLGNDQERWLFEGLSTSTTVWNVLGNEVVMSRANLGEAVLNYDQWDGYPVARDRLLGHITETGLTNVVVITGDIHLAAAADVTLGQGDAKRTVASEFVGTSISSGALLPSSLNRLLPLFPDLRYVNADKRGWTLCEVSATQWTTEYRTVDDPRSADSPISVDARFRVTPDRPGPIRI